MNGNDQESKNNNTINQETDNADSNTSETDNTNTTTDKSESIRNLEIIDISINTIIIIIISALKKIENLNSRRNVTLDLINDTNFAEGQPDTSGNVKFASRLNIYASAVFLCISWIQYQQLLAVSESKRDYKALKRAYDSFISSLLIFIATVISHNTVVY